MEVFDRLHSARAPQHLFQALSTVLKLIVSGRISPFRLVCVFQISSHLAAFETTGFLMLLHSSAILSSAILNCCKSFHDVSIGTVVASREDTTFVTLLEDDLAGTTELEGVLKPSVDATKKASMHGSWYFMIAGIVVDSKMIF